MSILEKIVRHKRKELEALKRKKPLESLKREVLRRRFRKISFEKALKGKRQPAIIAEVKKKSPSGGILRKDFDPIKVAKAYEKGGASALSVLTDRKFFAGSVEILKKIRKTTALPILRKDFIIDEYQLWEAKAIGADAILLIAGILSQRQMKKFYALARKLGLDALFEVHSRRELERVLPLHPRIVGVNNRDLKTFKVNLDTTKKLARFVKHKAILVSESGIFTHQDLLALKRVGCRAVLVGEGLIREADIAKALKKLLGK